MLNSPKSNEKILKIIFPLVFSVVGIVFICVSIGLKMSANHKKEVCTEKTTAVVVKLVEKHRRDSDGNYSYTYAPVFRYKANGKTVKIQSTSSSNPPEFAEGEEVELYYNPDKITEYYVKGSSTMDFIFIVLIAMGTLFTIIGISSVFIMRKFKANTTHEEDFTEQEMYSENK